MAPSASMLFLSYHQLHRGPAAAEAEAPREGGAGAGAGGLRFGFRNVFSPAVLTPPPPPPRREVEQGGLLLDGGDREENKAAEAPGARFEEAVRLSCWSS